jgi:hypothetical protein
MAALTSCRTCPSAEPVVEYVDRPIPVVAWPTFPDPAGLVKRDGEVVTMSLAYWLALTRYVIDVEAGIEIIEAYRGSHGVR